MPRNNTPLTRTLAAGGAALLGAAILLAALPAAAAPLPEPTTPAAQSRTIPGAPDDLSSKVCTGGAATYTQIETPDGVVPTVYALAGDTLEFYGETKACQNVVDPADALEWGFLADELAWTLRPAGGAAQDLGAGTVVQDGRTTVPSITRHSRTLTLADDRARLSFGARTQVESPNGMDFSGTVTTVILRVIQPGLSLTKEVCTASDPIACDPADAAVWSSSAVAVEGADVVWRLTAENTGSVALTDVAVAADVLEGGTTASNGCVGTPIAATLEPGETASIVCTTTSVAGGATVNFAKLTSTFADIDPAGRLRDRFGPAGVESNVAQAGVRILNPALGLIKQVCATGVGCDPADDAQWVDRVTVPLGTDAQWRLTATNTGDVVLADVVLSREELSGGQAGTSAECAGLTFGTLKPGESRSLDCTTSGIDDTTQDTVNTAAAHAQPIGDDGLPIALFPAGVDSPSVSAAVATSAFVQKPIVPEPPVGGSPDGGSSGGTPTHDAPDAAAAAGAAEAELARTGLGVGMLSCLGIALLAGGAGFALLQRRRARA